jgi:hypothetical protein
MRRRILAALAAVCAVAVAFATATADDSPQRNFAGSVQLDYLAVSHRAQTIDQGLEGATLELSLKLAMDLGDHAQANVKVCFACHGFELGMAYFDLRAADELNVRVGRFTPSFGSFPLRHDPANHQTSDKPLPYDMGRMVRFRDWHEGILPAPWVDNGVEINGTHFFGKAAQLDYAAYAISGPKGDGTSGDFDFTLSRSPQRYYADNNEEPALGARVSLTANLARRVILTTGASGMAGHYDPAAKLRFAIAGADASLQVNGAFLRAEYLARWTDLGLGDNPASRFKYGPVDGVYAPYAFKDGFDVEAEVPVNRFTFVARWDGLRHSGNVLATSALRSKSAVLRYTGAAAMRLVSSLRLKLSVERYDFSDFGDETALHLGIAGPF